MVGRRGEAPLVPPYILAIFKKALALRLSHHRFGERMQMISWAFSLIYHSSISRRADAASLVRSPVPWL